MQTHAQHLCTSERKDGQSTIERELEELRQQVRLLLLRVWGGGGGRFV